MSQEILIAVATFGLLAAALEVGFRFGRRATSSGDSPGGQIGAVQGATLGLLGLLLGFSFAGAAARFLERQDLIVREANAIGTAYLRADVLDEPHRSRLRDRLARYVEHRLALAANMRHGLNPAAKAEIAELHRQLWQAASEGVAAKPMATLVLLSPINEVIDLHASRLAAGRKHLPLLVVALLGGCSLVAMAVIGYGCGLQQRRYLPITGALAILIGAALWTTIDLDYSRAGLIRLDDTPLKELDLRRSP